MRHIILLALAFLIGGCASEPSTADVPAGTREIADDLTTGVAESSTATTDVAMNATGAYMGDSALTTVDTRAQRSASNANSGHIQKGFDFGGSATAAELRAAIAGDPILAAYQKQIDAEQAKESPDTARIDGLIEKMAARASAMGEDAVRMGGDLSALTHMTVVNTLQQHTGSGMPPLTDADAEASKMFPQVVEAAAKAIKQ